MYPNPNLDSLSQPERFLGLFAPSWRVNVVWMVESSNVWIWVIVSDEWQVLLLQHDIHLFLLFSGFLVIFLILLCYKFFFPFTKSHSTLPRIRVYLSSGECVLLQVLRASDSSSGPAISTQSRTDISHRGGPGSTVVLSVRHISGIITRSFRTDLVTNSSAVACLPKTL